MKCHQLQTAIGADPKTTDPEVLAHVQTCGACTEYRDQMLRMDALIYKALAVPVQSPELAAASRKAPAKHWQIAASLLATVAIAGSVWVASTRDSLAEQIVTHTDHESFAMVRSDDRVDAKTLNDILANAGVSIKAEAADVSYASSCFFHGHEVPHLVVQTEQGPVTVLVLAHEKPTQSMQQIDEAGYEGVIVPAPRGVIAVLGKDVPVEAAAQRMLAAVEYW
jgi:hypothetical protein